MAYRMISHISLAISGLC